MEIQRAGKYQDLVPHALEGAEAAQRLSDDNLRREFIAVFISMTDMARSDDSEKEAEEETEKDLKEEALVHILQYVKSVLKVELPF